MALRQPTAIVTSQWRWQPASAEVWPQMPTALYLAVADDNGEARLFLANCRDTPDRSHTLDQIRAALGEGVASLGDRAIEQIVTAFDLPSDGELNLASPVRVWRFLRRHQGKAASLVSVSTPLLGAPYVSEAIPEVAAPVEAPQIAERAEPGPWETAAGVATWRATSTLPRCTEVARPSRLRRLTAWGGAAMGALVLVLLNVGLADASALAWALGAR